MRGMLALALIPAILLSMFAITLTTVESGKPRLIRLKVDLGEEYSGVVNVVMTTPRGLYEKSLVLRGGRISALVDLSQAIDEWAEYMDGARNEGYVRLPSVYVWIYAVDGNGHSYIYSKSYTPIQYYLRKHSFRQAIRLAVTDPLGAYDSPVDIAIIRPHLRDVTSLYSMFEHFLIKNKIMVENRGSNGASRIHVMDNNVYTEPIYPELYNSRNTPPENWSNRIAGNIDDSVKAEIWYYVATTYSVKYYFPKNSWSLDNVVAWAQQYLGPQGFMSMETLVNRIAHINGLYGGSLEWINTYSEYTTVTLDLPITGMNAVFFEQEDIQAHLTYSALSRFWHAEGWTFLGNYIAPNNETLLKTNGTDAVLSVISPHKYVYFVSPNSAIVYMWDAMFLQWHITTETFNGEECWVVTPYITFTPYYQVEWDPTSIVKVFMDQPPSEASNMEWVADGKTVFDKTIDENYKPYPDEPTLVYREHEWTSDESYSHSSSLSLGIYMALLDAFLVKLGFSSPLASFAIGMASAIGYGASDAYTDAVFVTYKVTRAVNIDPVHVVITKNVFKAYHYEDLPLVIEFSIQVGDPSLPPRPNNPLNTTSRK